MQQENNKFTWGDSVLILKSAPAKFHPGEVASVCGFYKITAQQSANEYLCNIGDWVYTVEFGDGSDIQIAEHYLDKNLGIVHGNELSKYNEHFVNGIVLKIKIDITFVEIQAKSSPINQSISENFLLSNDGCFNGKIVIPQVESLTLKNSSHSMGWEKEGNILAFEMSDHELKLFIEWDRSKTTSLEIKSGQIWWEK